MAVWWVWVFTSWVTNWLDPEQPPVRLLLLVLMLAGLVLSTSLPEAFGDRGLAFAARLTFMQVGRSAFVLWVLGSSNPGLTRNFQRICAWLVLSGLFWLAGGLAHGGCAWASGPWHSASSICRQHWAFRARARGLADERLGRRRRAHGRALRPVHHHRARRIDPGHGRHLRRHGLGRRRRRRLRRRLRRQRRHVVALFRHWCRAGQPAHRRHQRIRAASRGSATPTCICRSWLASSWPRSADELALAHPLGHLEPAATAVLLGGPALYVLGNALFKRTIAGRLPLSHGTVLVLLALLCPLHQRCRLCPGRRDGRGSDRGGNLGARVVRQRRGRHRVRYQARRESIQNVNVRTPGAWLPPWRKPCPRCVRELTGWLVVRATMAWRAFIIAVTATSKIMVRS